MAAEREPPINISAEALGARLHGEYGLVVPGLDYLDLGADSWVYRVRTADRTYFLKVRRRVINAASLLVPRTLHEQGITHVIAPLPNAAGELWTKAGNYALILYPFVEGTTGMRHGMSEQQWIDFGALLRQVHGPAIAPELVPLIQRDTFAPAWPDLVRRLDARIDAGVFEDAAAQALATFWQAHRQTIQTLLDRADGLGRQIAQAPPDFVLCHADIHTNNVLLDADEQVWITDWDEVMLAPRERDLMFVIGGIKRGVVSPREEALFFQGYGTVEIDRVALTYYRYCWAISDIGAYGEQVVFRPDLGPLSRRAAVTRFINLFAPDSIVALACAS